MGIILVHSDAQRQFKKRMGQANHFLITILIGLEEVKNGNVVKPESLNVSWNPKNVKQSALRSRIYALNSSLSWIIDNFDSYVQNCKRKPCLIEKGDLRKEVDSADRRVNDKFKVFFNRYNNVKEIKLYGALVALGIQWRNITTHSEANNILEKEYEQVLLEHKEWYEKNCCNLKVEQALESFNAHENPSLKETASIIKAVLRFVELIDSELIKELIEERYLTELFETLFPDKKIKKYVSSTFTIERQCSMIKNVLLAHGFTNTKEQEGFDIDEKFMKKYFAIE